jgi:hypothetical protein
MAKQKPFELSEETSRLVAYLRSLEKGQLINYRELAKLVGIDLHSGHHKLTYARFILQRDHNAVWICVKPRVGIKRLTDVEIAERLPSWWLNGARNKLTRGGNQADVVDIKALDIDEQARFSVDCIQRELALESLSKAMRRKMEHVARGTSNDLPSFNVIEWAISLSPRIKPK